MTSHAHRPGSSGGPVRPQVAATLMVVGVALAVLLHVTVALGLITLAYLAAEWLARRRPVAALTAAGIVMGASLLVLILSLPPFR